MLYHVVINGKDHRLDLSESHGQWSCRLNGRVLALDAVAISGHTLSLIIDGHHYEIRRESTPNETHVWVRDARYLTEVRDPRSFRARKIRSGATDGAKKLVAAMPGKVVRLLVTENTEIEAGQGIMVMEAMKMQNELKSPKKGKVKRIFVSEGSAVNAGDALAIVE